MVRPAIAFSLGIWAAEQPDPSLPLLLLLAGSSILGFVYLFERIHLRPHERCMMATLWLAWFLAGLLRFGWVAQLPSESLSRWQGQLVNIQGTIAETPHVSSGMPGEWSMRYRIVLDSVRTNAGGALPQTASGVILMNVRQDNPLPSGAVGDAVVATGKVRLIHVYQNPGQPDRRVALAAQGVYARLSLVPGTFKIVQQGKGDSLPLRLERWRSQLRESMLQAMPNQDAALIMGMLFGGYDGIERQTVREFAATGIVHILSVSGAHIALLASAVFWLTGRLGVNDHWAAAIAAVVMLGYGFLSGFSAPVVRSVVMGFVCLLALVLGRRASAQRALALAVLGMLIYEPRNLFDISFQLSIGCTAGLLYLQPVLLGWLRGLLRESLAQALAATMAAQLAVIPFLAWYFGTLPLISLVANLLVAPLLEAVILLGLLATILAGALAPLAQVLFVGISLLLGVAVELNRFLCRLPGGTLQLPAMGLTGSGVYYATLIWTCGFAEKWGLSPAIFWRRVRRQPCVSCAAGLLIIVGASWIVLRPGPLQVHFIDVGQGDATLILTPHRRAILVDSGGALAAHDFDIGERVVVPYLRHYGVTSIDWLILTHNHQDHAGGAAAVARFVGVQQALVRLEEPLPTTILQLQQAMQFHNLWTPEELSEIRIDGIRLQLLQAGEPADNRLDGTRGSGKISGDDRKKAASSAENGQSTVVRVEYGRHSFLLTGDLEGEGEKKVMQQALLPSTVLKVGHHGGRKSTQVEFLNRVAPQYAVISVGADNRFGHPAPETIRRLGETPALLLRTDRDGAIVFHSDGNNLSFQRTAH